MGRSRDPYQIPKAGVEIAPLAGLASVNINRSVGPVSSTEFVGESTLGGVLVYAIYQALLTGLRTEAMRKRGALDRQTQIRLVAESVWASAKEGAAVRLSWELFSLCSLGWPSLVGLRGLWCRQSHHGSRGCVLGWPNRRATK